MRWLRKRAVDPADDAHEAGEADIRSAYRLLLGREPDAHGLRTHLQWAREHHVKPVDIARRFMDSDEYRARAMSEAELVRVEMDGYSVFPRRGDELIGAGVIQNGQYEPHVTGVFEKSLHPGAYVLDVGANIGLYTMRAAARVGSSGKVIAVEPLPQNHKALYAGISHNGFSNIWVLPFAASASAGLVPAICAPNSSNGIVGVRSPGVSQEMHVPTCRLDDVLSNLPRLDLVKMDIEGHEPVAWEGMTALMERHRPSVFTEFNPIAMRNVGQDEMEYLQALFEYGGRVLVLHRETEAVACCDAAAVMEEWATVNRKLHLDGEMHLDLYIERPN